MKPRHLIILAGGIFLFMGFTFTNNINSHNKKLTLRFPSIYFKHNSLVTVPFNFDTDSLQLTMERMSVIIMDNPTINMEITGHADTRENKPKELSIKRANYVENALLKLGVPSNRLITTGVGMDQLLAKDSIINKEKIKVLADSMRQMNRRVTFRVKSL
jgi:outer membrane protein OmpA-like peptidoglycan-associated protein